MKVLYVILKTKFMEMRKIALIGSISIFSLSILFHLLVIMKVIPSTIVWGGRIENQQELLKFESVSSDNPASTKNEDKGRRVKEMLESTADSNCFLR